MPSNVVIGLVLALYVVGSGLAIYFCAVADPNTSNTAYFIVVDLPERTWKMLSKFLDPKTLGMLSILTDRALVVVYLMVVLGSWSIVFWYLYPWIAVSSHVSNAHMVVGVFVFASCMVSWRVASTSRPGIITARSFQRYNHYPFDNLLFVPNQTCKSTNLVRIARSKYDRLRYNDNVPRYDHFCGWVHNTIGEENYRWFLLFLFIHTAMCAYGSMACYWLFSGEIKDQGMFENEFFDRITGETFKASYFLVMQYYFARRMPECALFTILFVMGIALGCFLGYHVYLTSYNMTTNEHGKWQDVHEWYKKKKRAYDKAVKDGLIKPDDEETQNDDDDDDNGEAPSEAISMLETNNDKDVTCTPSLAAGSNTATSSPSSEIKPSQPKQQNQHPEFFDPGPVPKNMYDRGFIENWKEVIFPMSLRENAEQQSYTLPAPPELAKQQQQQQPQKVQTQPPNVMRRAKGK